MEPPTGARTSSLQLLEIRRDRVRSGAPALSSRLGQRLKRRQGQVGRSERGSGVRWRILKDLSEPALKCRRVRGGS